jgi:regulator of replication initiation timing
MNGVEVILAGLNSKVEKLILLHKSVLEENKTLKIEIADLRAENEKLKQQLTEINHKQKNERFTEIISAGGFGKNELKVRLDAMIGEIDKCLAILNQ